MYLVTAHLWYYGRGVGIYHRGVVLLIGPVFFSHLGIRATMHDVPMLRDNIYSATYGGDRIGLRTRSMQIVTTAS